MTLNQCSVDVNCINESLPIATEQISSFYGQVGTFLLFQIAILIIILFIITNE